MANRKPHSHKRPIRKWKYDKQYVDEKSRPGLNRIINTLEFEDVEITPTIQEKMKSMFGIKHIEKMAESHSFEAISVFAIEEGNGDRHYYLKIENEILKFAMDII